MTPKSIPIINYIGPKFITFATLVRSAACSIIIKPLYSLIKDFSVFVVDICTRSSSIIMYNNYNAINNP